MNQMTNTVLSIEPNGAMTGRRVLVMDDDNNMRLIYKKALRYAGYEVHPASTLQEARDLLTQNHFDILLCDVCMDNGNYGTDLIREQFDHLTQHGTKVIMMSSESRFRAACEALGVDRFMEEPVGVRPLVELVGSLTTRQ